MSRAEHGGKNPPESDGYPTDLVLPTHGWSGNHNTAVTS
jgi:spore coat protein A, manganese oxidase